MCEEGVTVVGMQRLTLVFTCTYGNCSKVLCHQEWQPMWGCGQGCPNGGWCG